MPPGGNDANTEAVADRRAVRSGDPERCAMFINPSGDSVHENPRKRLCGLGGAPNSRGAHRRDRPALIVITH